MGLIVVSQGITVVRGHIVWALLVMVVDTLTQIVPIVKMGKLIVLLVGGKGYSSVRIGTPCSSCNGVGYLNPYNHIIETTPRTTDSIKKGECINCRRIH